jgi:hypothetical protein
LELATEIIGQRCRQSNDGAQLQSMLVEAAQSREFLG